jgi:hypothetical protein
MIWLKFYILWFADETAVFQVIILDSVSLVGVQFDEFMSTLKSPMKADWTVKL